MSEYSTEGVADKELETTLAVLNRRSEAFARDFYGYK